MTSTALPDLPALLRKAIQLLDQELDLLEPGQRTDLVKVLTELRHQVAALAGLLKAHGAAARLEAAVLAVLRDVDPKLALQVAERLAALPPDGGVEPREDAA